MSKFAITRPITTLMFALVLIFFGAQALKRISVSLYPNVDVPVITITTFYPGANANTVEGKVTDKIEEAISGIDELEKITSTTADNVSIVVAEFELSKPIEVAANDVRDKVSTVSFGSEVKSPIIEKFNVGGAPVISLFVTPKNKNLTQKELLALNTHTDSNIKPLLQRIKGVGKVNMVGYLDREVKILPNPSLLNKYNLSYMDLAKAINAQNIEIDGGRIIAQNNEWKILTKADATSIKELENIILTNDIKLGDIAKIQDSLQEQRTASNVESQSAKGAGILLEVQKITGANEIDIAKEVRKIFPFLQEISKDYELVILRDTTQYIQKSVDSVRFDLILGAILAVCIVFIFLRNFSVTIIASLSIPTSIMGTFAFMEAFGMTLNLATMIAITLAIGIIIDDAIVVIENIYKKLEGGLDRENAAYSGVREIVFALITISAMLLAVFIPIANMSGVVGRFFISFGITLSVAIIISFIIVITLIPMLGSKFGSNAQSAFYIKTEKYFKALESLYHKTLLQVLKYKILVISAIFALFFLSLFLLRFLGIEFLPSEDKSEFDIKIIAKPGISFSKMQEQSLAIQKELSKSSEVEYSILNIGYTAEKKVYEAKIYTRLVPLNKREKSQNEVILDLRNRFVPYSRDFGVDITLIEIPQISLGDDDSPFAMAVYSLNEDLLQKSVKNVMDFMEKSGKYRDIHTDLKPLTPQTLLKVNQAMAQKYGFSAKEIALAIRSAFSDAQEISYFRESGKEYDIKLLTLKRDSLKDLKYLTLRNAKGENVFLEGLVSIEEMGATTSIKRYDRNRSVMVYANLAPSVSLGEATSYVDKNANVWLQNGVNYKIEGYAKYMQQTITAFIVAMISAFFLIYFILASLYESLLQPFIIMITLPLSFTGAFLALFLSGESISLFSIMGLMLLMGMVGKNATLIIDVANEKRKEGATMQEAILQAGTLRLRPILMTTIAMIFGMLPLAFTSGAGSGIKSPMGIAMIGGLIVSMLLSLLIVPAFYKILAPLDDKLRLFYQKRSVN